jgi:hypothetical protein
MREAGLSAGGVVKVEAVAEFIVLVTSVVQDDQKVKPLRLTMQLVPVNDVSQRI